MKPAALGQGSRERASVEESRNGIRIGLSEGANVPAEDLQEICEETPGALLFLWKARNFSLMLPTQTEDN